MHLHISEVTIVFFAFSVLGWCMEVILKLIHDHRYINRGFLLGPYCPIYGFGVVAIIFLIGDVLKLPYGIFPTFLAGMTICGVLEYVTSWMMEKRYHARWWDYSTRPLNINGRVWIGNLILFGMASVVIMYGLYPLIRMFLDAIDIHTKWSLTVFIIILMGSDGLASRYAMHLIRDEIDGSAPDDTEEIHYRVHEALMKHPAFTRHLEKTFPSYRISPEIVKKKLAEAHENAIRSFKEADFEFREKKTEFMKELEEKTEEFHQSEH